MKRKAFTLAEILITLAIIGVVAAMTIPTLIAKINSIVTDNQIKVFNAKLIKGMNLTKTAGDLNNTYSSTYDFLTNGLGKNLKMAKVCDSSHIRDCIPYDSIKYDHNGKEESIEVKDLKTAGDLQIKNADGTNYADTAAFVLADGTPVIVTYDLNCIDDPDKADTTINKCLAGIYDLNGTRKPNKYGESEIDGKITHNSDLQPFNGARIANSALAVLGGVKIMTAAKECNGTKTRTYCDNNNGTWTVKPEYSKYGITQCCISESCKNYGDTWVTAMKTCQDQGYKLPTEQQLANIANALYGGTNITATDPLNMAARGAGNIGSGEAIPSALSGLSRYWKDLWSNSEGDYSAYYRTFDGSLTTRHDGRRDNTTPRVVCVAE